VRTSAGAAVLAFVVLLGASSAQAQSPSPRVELTGSLLLSGGIDFGTRNATLTGNDPGDPDFTLFSTATRLGSGVGPELRLGVSLTRVFAVEGAYSWTHQTLETRITGDVENGPDTTATQSVSTAAVGGDAVVRLTHLSFSRGRGVPFALAGGGYFRQTDGDNLLTASGGYVEAGGGVKYVLSARKHGMLRTLAIRADGRLIVRSGGINLGDSGGSHTTWGITAGLTVGF
jgi:hypothetical protein